MEITCTNFLATYGIQLRVFRYTIRNTSARFPTNNLFAFTLPAGMDAGLVYAWFDESPLDWQAWYGSATTEFGNTNTPIPPAGATTLEIRSESLATRFDYVTALAVGQDLAQPPALPPPAFIPVLVEVPAGPLPPKLTSVTFATNTVTLTAERLRFNYGYTLEQSDNMKDWTNAATFWVTWENTNLTHTISLPQPSGTPARFFRLRSP